MISGSRMWSGAYNSSTSSNRNDFRLSWCLSPLHIFFFFLSKCVSPRALLMHDSYRHPAVLRGLYMWLYFHPQFITSRTLTLTSLQVYLKKTYLLSSACAGAYRNQYQINISRQKDNTQLMKSPFTGSRTPHKFERPIMTPMMFVRTTQESRTSKTQHKSVINCAQLFGLLYAF